MFLLSATKYVSPTWLTMRQANELGGQVRKGEESTLIVFWKVEDRTESQDESDAGPDEQCRRRFVLKYYRLWNVEQCELQERTLEKLPKIQTHEHDPIESVERIIAGMPTPPTIEHAGTKALYSSASDRITMPPRNLFVSPEEYGSTILHLRIMPTSGLCRVWPLSFEAVSHSAHMSA